MDFKRHRARAREERERDGQRREGEEERRERERNDSARERTSGRAGERKIASDRETERASEDCMWGELFV